MFYLWLNIAILAIYVVKLFYIILECNHKDTDKAIMLFNLVQIQNLWAGWHLLEVFSKKFLFLYFEVNSD